jgi:aminopeptidase-like protein
MQISTGKEECNDYLRRLFPLCRSLAGQANRETLAILKEIVPLTILEVASGTPVFDWNIPPEWEIKSATIEDCQGRRLLDFANNNLHVVSYSKAVDTKLTYVELKNHIYTLPDQPDLIPYRTSYYQPNWGFCLSENSWQQNFHRDKSYRVKIESRFVKGSMSLGEFIIPGRSEKEFLVSTYICHPSMANDNLSGFVLAAFLARELTKLDLHYTYRFVFAPETIGPIAYLHKYGPTLQNIEAGLVTSTAAGPGCFGYKQSFQENHILHRMLEDIFQQAGERLIPYRFDIHGSDERQYSSPGFRIPTISLCKDKYYEYPEYHTSGDNLDFITAENLLENLKYTMELVQTYDANQCYRRKEPGGEIMLSKHGLYPKIGGASRPEESLSELDLILWILWFLDGKTDLWSIKERLEIPMQRILTLIQVLLDKEIIEVA